MLKYTEKGSNHAALGRVLIIAHHFPPCVGSSGLLRSVKFCRYLTQFGWEPIVLTPQARAHESVDLSSEKLIPSEVPVIRSFALDTRRHLGFRGFYQDWMAMPDRWVTWVFGAIPSGIQAISRYHIDIIFSTFPICTAVLIGFLLHLVTGKPWIVDLRDPMTEDNYPGNAVRRAVWRWVERKAMRHASRVIFTAPSTRQIYLDRYSHLSQQKCLVIGNGYDEEDFHALNMNLVPAGQPLRLLHTGVLYPEERDPRPFFRALARLKRAGHIDRSNLQIYFRAATSENLYERILNDLQITDLVELQPHVPYREALQECANADGLLLFQAANCDHQIPAKVYEYLRLGKPILALTTVSGDTAELLRETGGATIVNITDEDDICRRLPIFLEMLRSKTHPPASAEKAQRYSRRGQAEQLAKCLFEVSEDSKTPRKPGQEAEAIASQEGPPSTVTSADIETPCKSLR